MSEIRNNILNESYQLVKTDCGLQIGCYNMPGYNAVHAVFATNFGSVDRSFVMNGQRYDIPAGVAHFLEHKMFENEDGDAFDKYAKTGANANAFTSFDKTCYIFTATDKMLYDCAKAFYSPSQMFLSVAGNIDIQTVLAACDRAGFKYEVLEVERLAEEEPDEINYTEKSINMPVSVPLIAVGFKEKMSNPVTIKEELCGEIIMDVLSGSTSKLFNKLYDKNIVNGTFEGEIFSGTDYYATIISGETAYPDVLIKEIEDAIDELKKDGIGEDDFLTSKNSMYGSMIVDFENVEEVATNIASAHFKGRTAYTALETLSAISLEDVNAQLSEMFRKDKRTVFTVMPLEEKDD